MYDLPEMNGQDISCMMYADDLVLLATSEEALQLLI